MKNFILNFKKSLLLISLCCLIGLSIKSQTVTLSQGFDTYDGTAVSVSGWYFSWNSTSSPSYYVTFNNVGISAPSYKFGVNQDTMITQSFTSSNVLSFWCKGEGSTFSPDDTLTILWSPDSVHWNVLTYQSNIPTTGTTLTFPVNLTATNLMFIFTKYVGNLAIDDIKLTFDSSTGIPENRSTLETVNIYPNPTDGHIFLINKSSSKMISLIVYDVLGNNLINIPEQSIIQGTNEINLSSLNNGIYFLKTQSGNISEMRKIIIEK
jgi:hypothetical protein